MRTICRAAVRGVATFLTSAALASTVACGGGTSGENSGLPAGPLHWIDADPDWSPDGRQIVYTRGSAQVLGDDFNLRTVDRRSGRERALTHGVGHRDRDPDWSPDGKRITFVRSLDSAFCNGDDKVLVVAANARESRTRTRSLGSGCSPAWSPEGSKIAFLRAGSLYVASRVGVVNVLSRVQNRERRGVDIPGEIFDFDWSPDGSRLGLERSNEIWTVRADGHGLRRLTRSGYARVAHGPRWSPDGSLILHDRFDNFDEGLWVMRSDGSNARKIVDGEIGGGTWSPDGSQIVFGRTGDKEGLFVIDRNGGNERRLPDLGGGSFGGWSPDGELIAVGGDSAGTISPDPYPIVLIQADTGRATRITQRP